MKITTKGQVTIPIQIREELGLLPHTEVTFEIEDGAAVLRPAAAAEANRRGRRLVERLRGSATVSMSTDEILSLTRDGASPTPE